MPLPPKTLPTLPTPIKLTGRERTPELPGLLRNTARSSGAAEDPFLPGGYLTPKACFDVGPAARGSDEPAVELRRDTPADEVLVLELADGSTFITSAAKLKQSLQRSRPELIGGDGEILFDQLHTDDSTRRGLIGDVVGGLVRRVFAIGVGEADDAIIDAAKKKLVEQFGHAADLGVTWAGTKALMWAIEHRLDRPAGKLYRWSAEPRGGSGDAARLPDVDEALLARAAVDRQPMLVFVHGTGSNTLAGFGDLQTNDRDVWTALERQHPGGIYAFEHRTLSEGPIDNALQLAAALPAGACVSLVSHSRGGLVADLLCLTNFEPLIEHYQSELPGSGDADVGEANRVRADLVDAHAGQQVQLRALASLLRSKQLVVQRYVRVASPAQGTRLASANFDLFLSGLLTLIGQVPFFFGSPLYSAFKRVVLEIAKNRTNPHLVPGIEAMLPDSPMSRLLRDAPVQPGIRMAVIAGDIEGGNLLKRVGVLVTDFLLFDNTDNDLVVDTASMLGGIAPQTQAQALFDRGADVSHFRYFTNPDTRNALRDWLVCKPGTQPEVFKPLPAQFVDMDAEEEQTRIDAVRGQRGTTAADLPVVVVLPGVMGSHLWVKPSDRVWFDPLDIASGGLAKIAWGEPGVEAEKLFSMFYGKLCEHLAASHRVERFAYDWRQPLDVLGERLGEFLDSLLKGTAQPVRLLAHSMGGLVVRACIHKRRTVMDSLMQRNGARFVMLGTPNQGAHSMVENLIGKGSTLRTLVRVDVKHDMQEVLDIVAGFRGALQLLPKPGFTDQFQGQPDGGGVYAFQSAKTWADFKPKVRDVWFGDGRAATPAQAVLDSAGWLWAQDGLATPSLPADYAAKSAYVFGVARNTPCGVREDGSGKNARLKMVGTTRGDGTVSWESGRIGNVGRHYYLPAEHGDLPATEEYFPALAELLATGATGALSTTPPAVRAIEQPQPVSYDAGPPTLDAGEALARGLMGGAPRSAVSPRAKRRLDVSVKAMDLRFLSQPIMVGHYEQDPIAGPQSLIDRELLSGDLSERHSLGLYAGRLGTATVVLRMPNAQERRRGSLSGAVVTGLGRYDGALSQGALTEAVRAGVLRYLLQVVDVMGKAEREVPLATLLIGYNSSANFTVASSVEALVRGVVEANAKFAETTRLSIRVARLDIVELYLDTAITGVYALRQLGPKLVKVASRLGTQLVVSDELDQGEGLRQRLFDRGSQSYWPRLIVTDDALSSDPAKATVTAAMTTMAEKPGRAPVAERLRFLYVGQRARAESVVQQRQPGLIEKLVRQQIHVPLWQEDIGRMLFQLMVPPDFKDAARQLERVVLVVDATTANLPWELMFADERDGDGSMAGAEKLPLALRTPVVRQLASTEFRRQVRQSIERTALVVGNPSVTGFGRAFPVPGVPPERDPNPLPGAQKEAEAVAAVLSALSYGVTQAIGVEQMASDVLGLLYRQPYRVLHISAHGVFDQVHADGGRRSGVVLSDGLLITAAEIEAMETVPELVFLNCCHLGTIDSTVRDGNKLAASVARELIGIGVRCVVVAGWAVDDASAAAFGPAFYKSRFLERRAFGDAVFEARRAAYELYPRDITWGAFQAYGDPGWLAEPRSAGMGGPSKTRYASPDELLDELARIRADLSRRKERQTAPEIAAQRSSIEQLLELRCPPGWLALPALQSALGATWAGLGDFDRARAAYLAAVQAEDAAGRVPIRDIEQLAGMEAKLGEEHGDAGLVESALARLRGLAALVSVSAAATGAADAAQSAAARNVNSARSAALGSAFKRQAGFYARQVLRPGLSPAQFNKAAASMLRALQDSASAYEAGAGVSSDASFNPYNALNRIALHALRLDAAAVNGEAMPAPDPEAVALVRHCRQAAANAFMQRASLWNAVIEADALLVERLIDGSFMAAGDAGQAALDEAASAYAETLTNITVKPQDMEALLSQMCLMSRFADALFLIRNDSSWLRMASRLIALSEQIQPGACVRDDRPAAAAPAARKRKPAKAVTVAKAAKRKTSRA